MSSIKKILLDIKETKAFEKLAPFTDQAVWSSFSKEECHLLANLYWDWGNSLFSLGKTSGEPLDFHSANEKFLLAYQSGCRDFRFIIDYGHTLANLGDLLKKKEFFLEALKLFDQAINQNHSSFEALYYHACCILRINQFEFDSQLMEKAHISFSLAANLEPDDPSLWANWAQLEALLGKTKRDFVKVEASLEKFARAYALNSNHPDILICWAETELFLGTQEDNLELIHAAQEKIHQILEILPEDCDAWYLYGLSINILGNYFKDEQLYYLAIDKFKQGLSFSRNYFQLWHGLALSHFALGELLDERHHIEKSNHYFNIAFECQENLPSQLWNDWGAALLKLAVMSEQSHYAELAISKFEIAINRSIEEIDLEIESIDIEWIYNYGSAFYLLGDLNDDLSCFEKAIHILSQVLQLDPEYQLARYYLALSLSCLAEETLDVDYFQKAIEQFDYLLEHNPEDEVVHLDYGICLVDFALLIHDNHHPEKSQSLLQTAESHLMQAVRLGYTQAYYQLAGLYSLLLHFDYAMYYLQKAQSSNVLPEVEDLLNDVWLESLRSTEAFKLFIEELSSQQSSDDKF